MSEREIATCGRVEGKGQASIPCTAIAFRLVVVAVASRFRPDFDGELDFRVALLLEDRLENGTSIAAGIAPNSCPRQTRKGFLGWLFVAWMGKVLIGVISRRRASGGCGAKQTTSIRAGVTAGKTETFPDPTWS